MGCCGGMAAILNVSWVDKRDVGVNEEDVVVMVNTWMAWGWERRLSLRCFLHAGLGRCQARRLATRRAATEMLTALRRW